MRPVLVGAITIACAVGCGFFNTPAGKVVECSAAAAAEVLAQLCPPPVTPICTEIASAAFEQACQDAAARGANQDQATDAGLHAARVQLAKLQHDGFDLSSPTGGAR